MGIVFPFWCILLTASASTLRRCEYCPKSPGLKEGGRGNRETRLTQHLPEPNSLCCYCNDVPLRVSYQQHETGSDSYLWHDTGLALPDCSRPQMPVIFTALSGASVLPRSAHQSRSPRFTTHSSRVRVSYVQLQCAGRPMIKDKDFPPNQ